MLHALPLDPGPFDHLLYSIEGSLPRAFSLPEEIRGFFKDGTLAGLKGAYRLLIRYCILVASGRQGAFVNSGELKPGRAKYV